MILAEFDGNGSGGVSGGGGNDGAETVVGRNVDGAMGGQRRAVLHGEMMK